MTGRLVELELNATGSSPENIDGHLESVRPTCRRPFFHHFFYASDEYELNHLFGE